MAEPTSIDDVLVQWGDRLFYPGNGIVKGALQPKLAAQVLRQRANAIRARIEATVVRRAPQVIVKVTGGGRGMKAIAAHFKYISKNGRLDIEDDRGEVLRGKDDLRGLAEDWRLGGTPIDDVGFRREAFQHHAVDAEGDRSAVCAEGGAGVCASRARGSQVCDGAA